MVTPKGRRQKKKKIIILSRFLNHWRFELQTTLLLPIKLLANTTSMSMSIVLKTVGGKQENRWRGVGPSIALRAWMEVLGAYQR